MEINPTNVVTLREKASYQVPLYRVTNEGLEELAPVEIDFVKGNRADPTIFRQTGFMTETLLTVCLRYLQENNVGDLANRDTSIAITHIEDALLRLKKRADERKARGVQGTYQK